MARSSVTGHLCQSFSLVPLVLALGCATAPSPTSAPAPDFAPMLERQAEDWNRGDLVGFCSVYAEDAAFVAPSGVKRGRAQILARYEQKYDTPEKRGHLEFEVLETRHQGDAAASILMKWKLVKADGEASGHALVVLHRTAAGWKIVQDASM